MSSRKEKSVALQGVMVKGREYPSRVSGQRCSRLTVVADTDIHTGSRQCCAKVCFFLA